MGEKDNFVSCYRGLYYVGEILLPYTKDRLDILHQSIYGQLAGLPNCTDRCSEKHGRNTKRWCQTCSQWKDALEIHHLKGKLICWQNLKSWTWPTTRESMADVFVRYENANLRDIATACSIWKNCNSFTINHVLCERVLNLRHTLYGHNPDMKVSDLDKERLFEVLEDIVKEADVQRHINREKCLHELSEREKGNELEKYRAVIEPLKDKFEEALSKIDKIEASRDKIQFWWFGTAFIVLLLAFVCGMQHYTGVVVFQNNTNPWIKTRTMTDCVSESFTYPFPQDLPLFPYISNHQPLMGREWLFQKLTTSIYHSSESSNGVLVIAEMGYGKSALVSHVLCAKQTMKGGDIKQNIVAFHVCKFDVPSTTRVGRFIRRLIGFFATHSTEFGYHISFLNEHALIYDEDKCGKEPIACLDQGVTIPLEKVKEDKPWIVVVDALDECFDSDTDTNHILALLKRRIKKFPLWVKFIIFSRHMQGLDLKNMEVIHLQTNDGHNLNDIEMYLDYHKTILEKVKELFGTKSNFEVIKGILKETEGNFLFVTNAFEYAMDRYLDNRRLNLPRNLTDIYESNFERQFNTIEDFQYAKLILQIVCASLRPRTKSDINDILHTNNYTDTIRIQKSFDKLSFFLRAETQVTFIHKSIHEWLISQNNTNYKILPEYGHALLSKYLLENARRRQSIDFIEMAIHVDKADRKDLKETFHSIKHEHIEPKLLHRLIDLTDSVGALQLVLPYVAYMDPLDGQRQTPAFVAAAKGHLDQLRHFIEKGANLFFTKQLPSWTRPTLQSAFEAIEFSKTLYFSGYTLLHIAVTNNHLDVVKYILKVNSSLIYVGNHAGQLPSDIACRYGLREILQEIASLDSSIIGQDCVYLAAKYGHGHVIDFVRAKNVHCECVSEDASYKAYTSVVDTNSNPIIKPLDVWWVVFKESPLHVAVRNGHHAVVKTLVTYYSHLLDCVDAFGRTPFLTSIWYNQVSIFTFLSFRANETSEVCSHPYHDLFQLTLSKELTEAKNCHNGFSMAHLFARFDRGEMINYAIENVLNIDWLLLDDDGYPAEHYAACFGSITYLTALRDGYIPAYSTDTRRYKHGMTIYHSAALCGRNESLRVFTGGTLGRTIPQFVDDRGRGVLFYTFMEHPIYTNTVTLDKCSDIVILLLNSGHSLVQFDLDRRNILHYALLNGFYKYIPIMKIYHTGKSTWFTLIEQRDVTRKTPVEFSLSRNVGRQNTYFKHPKQCAFYEIYYTGCEKETKEELMYPWEIALYQTFQIFYTEQSGHTVDRLFLSQIYTNYPYLTTAVLVYLNNAESDLRRYLLRTMRFELPPNNLFHHSLFAITNLKPRVLVVCNQHFHRSPLHKLVYTHILAYDDMVTVFEHVQKSKLDWGCPDKTGLNIFHYAILGGNIQTSNYLMQHRITMTTKAIQHKDIILMALFPWKLTSQWKIRSISDSFLADFLSMHVGLFKHTDFCTNGTKGLSVVHLLSFNGMFNTLRVIKSMFGPAVMSCTTKDGFTPNYLCKFSNTFYLSRYAVFAKSVQIVHTPRIEAEIYLLYKLRDFVISIYSKFLESFQCPIEVLHLRFSNIRKKYSLLKCIEAYKNWKSWLVPEIQRQWLPAFQTDINIMQMKPFLEIATQLDTLLLQKDSNCLAIHNFLTVDMRQILSSLDRTGIFSAGTSKMLLRYLMNVISRGDIECPLSEHASNRLTVILDATNHLVSKLVPWSRRTSTMNFLTIHYLYSSSVFIKERSMHLLNRIRSEVRIHKSKREPGVDFAAVYKDFRYLDIIENSLFYRTWFISFVLNDFPMDIYNIC